MSGGENSPEIDPHAQPSGTGCVECDATGGWWFHLRRCAACGHIGCCDSSPGQHATHHARDAGHPILTSFEPGEDWFFDDRDGSVSHGPVLAGPQHHPADQGTPGPTDRVPRGLAAPPALSRVAIPSGRSAPRGCCPPGWPASTSSVSIAPVKRAEPQR